MARALEVSISSVYIASVGQRPNIILQHMQCLIGCDQEQVEDCHVRRYVKNTCACDMELASMTIRQMHHRL